jgi:hypothetical protein
MTEEKDSLHCPACGRLMKKIEGLCPFCGANPKDIHSEIKREEFKEEHLKIARNTRFQRKDKQHGMKKG